jgi:hypothetical protein
MLFAVDDLLAAGIDNDDLVAAEASRHLQRYLDELRHTAARFFTEADAALAAADRPNLRHLSVLAAVGARQSSRPGRRSDADFRLADLYNAWTAARRAARGRGAQARA